jgi:hypothetical protein
VPPPPPPPTPATSPPPLSPPQPGGFAAAPGGTGLGPVGTPRSIAVVILLSIVTFGIYTWVWSFKTGNELKEHNREGLGGAVYLVITLFISPVTMFLMAGEVEKMYRNQRREPPITTLWGLWFLLPLIGNIVWYVRIQRSINEYWASVPTTAAA